MRGVIAVQRLVHMVEAGPRRLAIARHQCVMGAIVGQSFESGHPMFGGHDADRFHLRADIDRLEARDALLDLGDAFADAIADDVERIGGCHG